jgi:hypothetical protein
VQNLDRYLTSQYFIVSSVDDSHAAVADLLDNAIT